MALISRWSCARVETATLTSSLTIVHLILQCGSASFSESTNTSFLTRVHQPCMRYRPRVRSRQRLDRRTNSSNSSLTLRLLSPRRTFIGCIAVDVASMTA